MVSVRRLPSNGKMHRHQSTRSQVNQPAQHTRYVGIMICTSPKNLTLLPPAFIITCHQLIPIRLVLACSGGTYIAVETDCKISSAFSTARRLSYSSRMLSLSVLVGSEIGAGRCFLRRAVPDCLTSGTGFAGTADGLLSSFFSRIAVSSLVCIGAWASFGLVEAVVSFAGFLASTGFSPTIGGWEAVCLGATLILSKEINTYCRRPAWVDGGGEGGRRTYPSTGVVCRLLPAALLTELRLYNSSAASTALRFAALSEMPLVLLDGLCALLGLLRLLSRLMGGLTVVGAVVSRSEASCDGSSGTVESRSWLRVTLRGI